MDISFRLVVLAALCAFLFTCSVLTFAHPTGGYHIWHFLVSFYTVVFLGGAIFIALLKKFSELWEDNPSVHVGKKEELIPAARVVPPVKYDSSQGG